MTFEKYLQSISKSGDFENATLSDIRKMYDEELRELELDQTNDDNFTPYRFEPANPHLYYQ